MTVSISKRQLWIFSFCLLLAFGFFLFIPRTDAIDYVGGELIKGSSNAVYYVGADLKRYVFPNERIFKTWYADFGVVTHVPDEELNSLPLAGVVRYKPGIRMIKIPDDPKVYTVGQGGLVHHVNSETITVALYGSDWNTKIDDMLASYFVSNYTIGDPITEASQFNPPAQIAAATSISADFGLIATQEPKESKEPRGTGCKYNNPPCSGDTDCIDNTCILKIGCQYSNPRCDYSKEDCVNNECIRKTGCQHKNPACPSDHYCEDNQCILNPGCKYNNPACQEGYKCINNKCVERTCSNTPTMCVEGELCVRARCITVDEYLPSNNAVSNSLCELDEVYVNNACQKAKLNFVFYSLGTDEATLNDFANHSIAGFLYTAELSACRDRIRIHKLHNLCVPVIEDQHLKEPAIKTYLRDIYGENEDVYIHPLRYHEEGCSTSDHWRLPSEEETNTQAIGGAIHELGHVAGLWDQYCYYPPETGVPNPVNFDEANCREPENDWYRNYCSAVRHPPYGEIEPFQCSGNLNRFGGYSIMGGQTPGASHEKFGFTDQEIEYMQQYLDC